MAKSRAKPQRDGFERVAFSGFEGAAYPTADGRQLRLTSDDSVRAGLAIRNETRHAERAREGGEEFDDLPTDILAADLRLADAAGRVWQATSYSDAELLLAQMIDVSRIEDSTPSREVAPARGGSRREQAAGRDDYVLTDVLFSSDDRFIRTFAVFAPPKGRGKKRDDDAWVGKVVQMQFKYTVMAFDVGFQRPFGEEDDELRIRVRLQDKCVFDYETHEDIGPLEFSFDWRVPFQVNRHSWTRRDDGHWRRCELPLPLVFRPIEGTGSPQPHVIVA